MSVLYPVTTSAEDKPVFVLIRNFSSRNPSLANAASLETLRFVHHNRPRIGLHVLSGQDFRDLYDGIFRIEFSSPFTRFDETFSIVLL
jgi:hypothetical protein